MKYLIALLAMLPAIALSAGTTANLTLTWPTEGTQLSPVTGQQVTVPLAITDFQKAVIRWYSGTTLVGSVDLVAPATKIAVPNLVCGDYSFAAYAVLKSGTQSPDSAPPLVHKTDIVCTTIPKAPAISLQ